jgi:toxin YhaV
MNEGRQISPLAIQSWTVFAHPRFMTQVEALVDQVEAFVEQVEALVEQVEALVEQVEAPVEQDEALKKKDPTGYVKKNATNKLAAIVRLAFDVTPQDLTRAEYGQGEPLGDDRQHWFRAEFFQQTRPFCGATLRPRWSSTPGSMTTAPSVPARVAMMPTGSFKKLLESGHPHDDWKPLPRQNELKEFRL